MSACLSVYIVIITTLFIEGKRTLQPGAERLFISVCIISVCLLHVLLSVLIFCLFVCLSVYIFVCLFVCLSVCLDKRFMLVHTLHKHGQ